MKAVLHLVSVDSAHKALSVAWAKLKPFLMDGQRFEVEIRPERRNTEQNALLHALLSELAARKEWAGRLWDTEQWKRMVTAAWLRAEGESVVIVPAIDGHGMDIVYAPTHTLSKAQMASLLDYLAAYMVEQGIDVAEAA